MKDSLPPPTDRIVQIEDLKEAITPTFSGSRVQAGGKSHDTISIEAQEGGGTYFVATFERDQIDIIEKFAKWLAQ